MSTPKSISRRLPAFLHGLSATRETYCSEIRLARYVIASLRNMLGGGFAVSMAGLDEMIDEVVLT